MSVATGIALFLTNLFVLDRGVKVGLVARFFARPAPPAPSNGWPTVALIQPVTRGATRLAANLEARSRLEYPGTVQHFVVCDRADEASQAICRTAIPHADLVLVEPDVPGSENASKVAKMAAGVAKMSDAVGVVCFVDDDILLPCDGLDTLVAPLYADPLAGATFGLACQVSWSTLAECLMSGFVNANALTSYIPLTFFTPSYTITGHIFALRRDVFAAFGGMSDLSARRFDDDHEIARRVRSLGFVAVQTPLVYRVANALPTLAAYATQMRRWFVIPRQGMIPHLTRRERTVSSLLSLGNLLPSLLLLLALVAPDSTTWACVAISFLVFLAGYAGLETRYLPVPRTPPQGILLLPIVAFLTPLHVLLTLLWPGDRIRWRGHTYRIRKDGAMEVDET